MASTDSRPEPPARPASTIRSIDLLIRNANPARPTEIDPALLATTVHGERRWLRAKSYIDTLQEFRTLMIDFRGPADQKMWYETTDTHEILHWTGWKEDCQRWDELSTVFNNSSLTDQEFSTSIRSATSTSCTVEQILRESQFFSLLEDTSTLAEGKSISPLEHILLVLEKLETDGLTDTTKVAYPVRPFLRWFVFFHDLAKVVKAKHLGHGLGGAEIARTYFSYANEQAKKNGQADPYSREFIEQIAFVLEHHHVFQQLAAMFKTYLAEQGMVTGMLVSEVKSFLAIFNKEDLPKELKTAKLQELYDVISSKGMRLFNMREFQQRFPLLFSNPDLFLLVSIFTKADVKADGVYDQRYGPQNTVMASVVLKTVPKQ